MARDWIFYKDTVKRISVNKNRHCDFNFSRIHNLFLLNLDEGAIYQAKNDFKCPLIFGAFPDPTDCAHYYVCVAGVAVHKKCGILQNFDVLRRRCLPILVAICGNGKIQFQSG